MPRRKALLIGINYFGTDQELAGCINDAENVKAFLVEDRGWSDAPEDMLVLTDAPENEGTEYWPSMENIVQAIGWLVNDNEDGDAVWLSYSGHGGQVKDLEGERASGYDDSILPVDWSTAGQITSDQLHPLIISPMNPNARLTILFDCCHSGSACELPFVYRPDADGNITLLDTLKQGAQLISSAQGLLSRGISSPSAVEDAKVLLGGATDFFNSLSHRPDGDADVDEDGLAKETFAEDWHNEGKDVWMFSGCADDQTSADTHIAGAATGAMSWAFIGAMRENPEYSYIEVLRNTRESLVTKYSQIPQLSCGGRYDLDQVLQL